MKIKHDKTREGQQRQQNKKISIELRGLSFLAIDPVVFGVIVSFPDDRGIDLETV